MYVQPTSRAPRRAEVARATAVSSGELVLTTQTRPSSFSEAARRKDRLLSGSVPAKQPLVTTRTRPSRVTHDRPLSGWPALCNRGLGTSAASRCMDVFVTAGAAQVASVLPRLTRAAPGRRLRIQPQGGQELLDNRPLEDGRDDLQFAGASAARKSPVIPGLEWRAISGSHVYLRAAQRCFTLQAVFR
jgi:hypothetical protein